jgi:hypothetical protein
MTLSYVYQTLLKLQAKKHRRLNTPDFLKFVGPSEQKITRTGNTAKYAGPGVRQIFVCVFCFAPKIGNATGMPERSQSTWN